MRTVRVGSFLSLLIAGHLAAGCSSDMAGGGQFAGNASRRGGGSDAKPDDDADETPSGPGGTGTANGALGSDGTDARVGGVNTGLDSGNATPGINTGGGELVIAGVPVVRVGVNFEDAGLSGDRDYNDAVLCFQGAFKVDKSNVVSVKSQQVVGTTSSRSGCTHNVRVEVVHADGTREPSVTFGSRSGTPVTMNFRPGSKLEVFMRAITSSCSPEIERTMHNDVDCRVLPDVCNTTGG